MSPIIPIKTIVASFTLASASFLGAATFNTTPTLPNIAPNFITITNVSNKADGAFQISRASVIVAEYAIFLNAVAADDPHGLWNKGMDNGQLSYILRSGTPGNYHYTAIDEVAYNGITSVSWFSAARYCNWLHNGQPTGKQDETTTEDGAYRLDSSYFSPFELRPGARYFLPTESQWNDAVSCLGDDFKNGGALLQWTCSSKLVQESNSNVCFTQFIACRDENSSHISELLDSSTEASNLSFHIAAPPVAPKAFLEQDPVTTDILSSQTKVPAPQQLSSSNSAAIHHSENTDSLSLGTVIAIVIVGALLIAGTYFLAGPGAATITALSQDYGKISEKYAQKQVKQKIFENGTLAEKAAYAVSDNNLMPKIANVGKSVGIVKTPWYEKGAVKSFLDWCYGVQA